jgi:histidinol dehydrogenase
VRTIIEAVRRGGDVLREYTARFDRIDLDDFRVPKRNSRGDCGVAAQPLRSHQ